MPACNNLGFVTDFQIPFQIELLKIWNEIGLCTSCLFLCELPETNPCGANGSLGSECTLTRAGRGPEGDGV